MAALQAGESVNSTLSTEDQPGQLRVLALDSIAAHPLNPRHSLGDLGELTASIQEFGVLQPPVVIPAAAFLAERPREASAIGSAEWVIVAGHRRHAAAKLASLPSLAVIVREDLAAPAATAAAFVVENVHRAPLSPIEEGQAFALLADLGFGQREIARRVGVSQSHVSKRLALLRLPQAVQDDLVAGRVVLSEALALAAVSPEEQTQVWDHAQATGLPVAQATAALQTRQQIADRRATARAQAQAENLEVIDPERRFGREAWAHELSRSADIEAARVSGVLAGAITDSGLTYYSLDKPASPADAQAATAKARSRACARFVAQIPEPDVVSSDLARVVVAGDLAHSAAVRLAHDWLGSRYPTTAVRPRDWLAEVCADTQSAVTVHVAWALTVARDEIRTAESASWGGPEARHVSRLVASGYVPAAWEQDLLAAISE